MISLLVMATVMSGTARADCVISVAEVDAQIVGARRAFLSLDLEQFSPALYQLRQNVICLDVVIPGATAAGVHEIEALSSFLTSNTARGEAITLAQAETVGAFQSAVLSDPAYAGPEGLVPSSSPLHTRFREAVTGIARQQGEAAFRRLPRHEEALFYVDGQLAKQVPENRPVVLQRVDPEQIQTTYLAIGDALPDWTIPPLRTRLRPVVRWSAVGAVVLTGALWGVALNQRRATLELADQLDGDDPPERDMLENAVSSTNTLGTLAQVSSGLTVGLGVTALVW